MTDITPGLAPRKLELEEPMTIVSDVKQGEQTPTESSPTEQADDRSQGEAQETHVEDNTSATEREQEDTPLSERAQNRVQALANERNQARQEAEQYKRMLQQLVGNQVQPKLETPDEILAKQYKSYDPSLGFPTDPKEYTHFNEFKARNAAREEYARYKEQDDLNSFIRNNPDVMEDDALLGAIAAERAAAQRKGITLSYTEASNIAKDKLEKRFAKRAAIQEQQDISQKNEAYVETTRGGNTSRKAPEVDPDKMSLKEKEAWLKANGAW